MRSRGSLLVLPGYLALTVLLTWPLAREWAHLLPASAGWSKEALGGPFIVGWVLKTLFSDPRALFHLPIFHPEPLALAYTDHLIGESLVAAPFVAMTGSLAAGINAVVMLSFVISAWAVYRLARLIGTSREAAFLAGFLYAFAPFRFSNLTLLNQLQTQFIPLGLFFALRYARRYRRRDLLGAAATLVVQSYFGWYYALFLALALVLLAIYARAAGWHKGRDVRWRELAIAAFAGGALMLPGLLPYLQLRVTMPDYQRTLGMTALYSADLLDYFKVDRGNWLLGRWPPLTTGLACCPGIVTVALMVVALGAVLGRGDSGRPAGARAALARLMSCAGRAAEPGYFVTLGAAAFVFSLGPVLHVAGKLILVPLPYAALHFLFPGFISLRGPARLAVLTLLAATVLAAIGYDHLTRRLAAGRPDRRAALFGVVLAAAMVTSFSVVSWVAFPSRESMPPAYRWLERQPGTFAILELPLPATESDEDEVDALRQFYILYHGRPSLDGMSGFVPPAVRRLRAALQRFPSAAVQRQLAGRGARYLVVHLDELDPEARSAWALSRLPGLTERARFGNDRVLELDAPVD